MCTLRRKNRRTILHRTKNHRVDDPPMQASAEGFTAYAKRFADDLLVAVVIRRDSQVLRVRGTFSTSFYTEAFRLVLSAHRSSAGC